jgi:tRNA (adenine37-N6)-methyltransferase
MNKMEDKFKIKPIGVVKAKNHTFSIHIDKEFIPALTNIEGFNHLQIIWWGNLYDSQNYRSNLICEKPYKKGPDKLGVFATRSPVRPNPVLITNIAVIKIDYEKGIIYTPYIDAEDETPVLDIKPYHLNERIKDCSVPQWCQHWPKWYEDSATFNWQKEFNF